MNDDLIPTKPLSTLEYIDLLVQDIKTDVVKVSLNPSPRKAVEDLCDIRRFIIRDRSFELIERDRLARLKDLYPEEFI